MIVQIVILALLYLIMINLPFLPGSLPALSPETTTAVLGFILLASFFFGRITSRLHLPLITGYLIAGMVFGPYGLELFRSEDVERLAMIDSLALSFIALAAGGELDRHRLVKRAVNILTTTAVQIAGVFIGVAGLFYLLLHFSILDLAAAGITPLYAALILGVVATANSPSSVVAIINESKAKGPVTEMTLGVTVIKDIIVILLFALILSWIGADAGIGMRETQESVFIPIFYNLALSIVVGTAVGLFVILYLNTLRGQMLLFTIGVAVIASELSSLFDLNVLLVCIIVGFVVRNFSQYGSHFIHAIERGSMPIFVIFFTLTGAMLDLGAVKQMWFAATLYFVSRLFLTWVTTATAARLLNEPVAVRKHLWGGFVAQAGVSLGLAVIVKNQFPDWGPAVSTLIVASVVINQLTGPVIFKFALAASKETGREDYSDDEVKRADG